MNSAPHLQLDASECPARVVVCGDPARAERIAMQLDSARCLKKNREYHSWAGRRDGVDVLVVSHGIGGPGAAICFNELANLGARSIVRVGTAGGVVDSVGIGDIVVATGAVRLDGVSHLMLPPEYPAVPSWQLSLRIAELCQQPTKMGIVLTTALFYPSILPGVLETYRSAGVLAVEMETATLFIVGALRGMTTASVLVIDGSPLKWEQGQYAPTSALVDSAMTAAIAAALAASLPPGDGTAST
jgi:uridine phosphorylase